MVYLDPIRIENWRTEAERREATNQRLIYPWGIGLKILVDYAPSKGMSDLKGKFF
jgi:hypothetical protein